MVCKGERGKGEGAKTYEVKHPSRTELWLHGPGEEDGGFAALHTELGLAVLDHVEFERDDAGDFDGAAEGDFAVAL